MTGDIIRAITLTTYGTAFLRDNYDIDNLTLEHSSFKFANNIEFLTPKKRFLARPSWHVYADNPIDWLKKLKEDGCQKVRMVFQQDNSINLNGQAVLDYKLAGFVGGGGNRYIQTIFSKTSDIWQSREKVTDKHAPNNKIWTISYGRILTGQQIQAKREYNIENIRMRLKDKLTQIAVFAENEKLTFWAEWFHAALNILDSTIPFEDDKSGQIIPQGKMNLKATQLLAGSGKAWCFGGMGSWNDIGFEEKEKNELYDRLTSELYDVVNESYIAVANSY
jgi:hypothetical protein